ncbi:Crp/Fnr family transcriptional regulator [Nitrospirillum sp. BR 11828]|uniref:Crp/Fnr family transcriptional regulator n=1 Tax=Nitrospirillum sp. BR 11828 TaxID=3104325 RepID=UPI002ACABD8B|nr:Crp/Fnr family transcriptional regulator [Nitrospirillum sp. BR 11828]MDZ5649087.1 Crp/Fnr family transcriptional regulator [Nitrospirillum sp. BR 11828]
MDKRNAAAVLETRGWLAEQPADLRAEILARGRLRAYADGQAVYRGGDAPDGLYALVAGRMRLATVQEDGREVVILHAGPGQWFGEVSMVDGLPRGQTAVAKGDSLVLHLPGDAFARIVEANPRRWANFAGILSRHLRQATHYLGEVLALPTPQRTARLLALLCRLEEGAESGPVLLPLSQEDLAGMLGLSRQTANRALGRLEAAGLVRRGYGGVEVRDRAALERFAD